MKKKLLLICLGFIGSMGLFAQSSPYTGSVLAEGDYYLYNVETGKFIQGLDPNNAPSEQAWSTGAGLGEVGFDFTLSKVEGQPDNNYKLNAKFSNTNCFGYGLGDGGVLYLDAAIGGNAYWTFTKVDGVSNGYEISYEDATGTSYVLGADAGGNYVTNTGEAGKTTWQLVTTAERLKYVQEHASATNPIDVTFLLGNYNFTNNANKHNLWVETTDADGHDWSDAYHTSRVHALWKSGNTSVTFTVANVLNGTYQYTFQGCYRCTDRASLGNLVKAGKENLAAQYFIGNTTDTVMSILKEAKTEQMQGTWEKAYENTPYYAPDNIACWSRLFGAEPAAYTNKPIFGYITDGNLVCGVRKYKNKGEGDWLIMKSFRLKYLGSNIDVNALKAQLKTLIDKVDNMTGGKTNFLVKLYNQAVDAYRSSNDPATINDLIKKLENAISENNSVLPDFNNFAAVVKLAQADGVSANIINAAQEKYDNATKASDISEAIKSVRVARKLVHAERDLHTYAGHEVEAGQEYYLLNVGQKRYFLGGGAWGTHASVGYPGIPVKFEATTTEGAYRIDCIAQNGNGEHYLNYGGFVDTASGDTWKLVSKGDGKYSIVRTTNNNMMLGFEKGSEYNVQTDVSPDNTNEALKSGPDDADNQWILVTQADREALLATANKKAPVDCSYLIQNPNFLQRQPIDKWTLDATPSTISSTTEYNAGIWGRGGNHEDFALEGWNTSSSSFSTNITGLKAGYYTVGVQGFYRDGSYGRQDSIAAEGGELVRNAILWATPSVGKDAQLPNIMEEKDKAPGEGTIGLAGETPYWINNACLYFRNGLYKTHVIAKVASDGALSIGVDKDQQFHEQDWVVVDNFRLMYWGTEAITEDDVNNVLTGINEVNTNAKKVDNDAYYTIEGIRVNAPTRPGLYIHNGKKYIKK